MMVKDDIADSRVVQCMVEILVLFANTLLYMLYYVVLYIHHGARLIEYCDSHEQNILYRNCRRHTMSKGGIILGRQNGGFVA